MSQEKVNPQSPEEITKAAQEAAIKAAMEQAQSMLGSIPGFQIPDIAAMQEQIRAQMQVAVPNLSEIQAQQAAMGTLGGINADHIAQEGQDNMAFASQMMQAMMDGSLEEALRKTNDNIENDWIDGEDTDKENLYDDAEDNDNLLIAVKDEELWQIERADDGLLTPRQLHLLAFGAPLFVYNSEQVDSTGSTYSANTTREQMQSWWGIVDHDTTFETVRWLLEEGHHTTADRILHILRTEGIEALQRGAEEDEELAEKIDEVLPILQLMPRLGCTTDELPATSIGWDLVRVTNVARWTYQCGYISEEEIWQVMELVESIARQYFTSWQEYGFSYILGRGVWHGDRQDSMLAYEISETLLRKKESPWKLSEW